MWKKVKLSDSTTITHVEKFEDIKIKRPKWISRVKENILNILYPKRDIFWTYINFYWKEEFFEKNNLKNNWRETYVISPVDSKNKYSAWYADCTWIVALWKQTNWEILSLLSHQCPEEFLHDSKKKFVEDLSSSLK